MQRTEAVKATDPTGQVSNDGPKPAMSRRESIELLTSTMRGYAALHERVVAMKDRKAEFGQGLEKAAYRCLFILEREPLRSGEVAEKLFTDPSTVSRHIAALVSTGYVRREADPADGRASILRITDEGRSVCDHIRASSDRMVTDVLVHWSDEDLAAFAELFKAFLDDTHAAICAGFRHH